MTLSQSQRQRRQDLGLGDPSLFPMNGFLSSETTKETKYIDSGSRKREGSPPREAGSPRSSSTLAGATTLVGAARLVFAKRPKLYSTDGLGRRSEIETGHLGELGYQSLLEAIRHPLRLDDPRSEYPEDLESAKREREGVKAAPLTELRVPDWWELPEEGVEREQVQEAIRRNLARAEREGKGIFRPLNGRRFAMVGAICETLGISRTTFYRHTKSTAL